MWSRYSKIFCFRDCFDKEIVDGNVEAINKLINKEQLNGDIGCFVTTDILQVSTLVDKVGAYKSEDDGTWNIYFLNKDNQVASVSTWDYKEVQLCFEIEEETETDKFQIYNCGIKAFKEYQM